MALKVSCKTCKSTNLWMDRKGVHQAPVKEWGALDLEARPLLPVPLGPLEGMFFEEENSFPSVRCGDCGTVHTPETELHVEEVPDKPRTYLVHLSCLAIMTQTQTVTALTDADAVRIAKEKAGYYAWGYEGTQDNSTEVNSCVVLRGSHA